MWIALLVSIAVTMALSVINWMYKRSRVAKDKRNGVNLAELHSLFVFGLLVSKGSSLVKCCINGKLIYNNCNKCVSAGYPAPSSFKMRLAGGAWCIFLP